MSPSSSAFARSFGAVGETIHRTEEFVPAFERALTTDRPVVLVLILDAEVITPTRTLSDIREEALRHLVQE